MYLVQRVTIPILLPGVSSLLMTLLMNILRFETCICNATGIVCRFCSPSPTTRRPRTLDALEVFAQESFYYHGLSKDTHQ